MTASTPTIGVFDSGFGGLTVLRALRRPHARGPLRLPRRHRPPALRLQVAAAPSPATPSRAPSSSSASRAPTSSSSPATPPAPSPSTPFRTPCPSPSSASSNPAPPAASAASVSNDVLVIATDATVHSHAYRAACNHRGLRALEKACPLLVPLVEEGWMTGRTSPLFQPKALPLMRRNPRPPSRRWPSPTRSSASISMN